MTDTVRITVWRCVWICICFTALTSAATSRQEVTSFLLDSSRYDSSIVPDFEKDYPTNVTIQIKISDIHSISETYMEYSLDMLLRQWWRDGRLDYSNFTSDVLELDPKNVGNVWQPDIFFANEKRATVHTVTTTNKLMHMFPNGTVVYSMRLGMTLSCTMDLQVYPFDRQRCPLFVESFAYTKDNINLCWKEPEGIDIASIDPPQFRLSKMIKYWDYIDTDPEIGQFSTLKAEIRMERKLGFFFLQVFIPSVLLVALSWVNFWVDPHAVPARVSLGVTCILTMTTQSSGTRQSLPPVSYVKAIDVWMFVCLVFVFAALLEFACVNVLLRYDTQSFSGDEVITEEKKKERRKMAVRVDYISRIVFPGLFFIFVASFTIINYLIPQLTDTFP